MGMNADSGKEGFYTKVIPNTSRIGSRVVNKKMVLLPIPLDKGLMNICIPFNCVEDVIERLNTKYWYATMQSDDENIYKEAIETAISKASIPIRALLGKSMISVNDFVNLTPGDIIKLDSKVNEELDIYVGNLKKFTALPGATAESYAMRITSVIREE